MSHVRIVFPFGIHSKCPTNRGLVLVLEFEYRILQRTQGLGENTTDEPIYFPKREVIRGSVGLAVEKLPNARLPQS